MYTLWRVRACVCVVHMSTTCMHELEMCRCVHGQCGVTMILRTHFRVCFLHCKRSTQWNTELSRIRNGTALPVTLKKLTGSIYMHLAHCTTHAICTHCEVFPVHEMKYQVHGLQKYKSTEIAASC